MNDLARTFTDFIAHNSFWAGPVVGLLTFGESLVVVGALLPATLMLVAAGGLIATGTLDATTVCIWALAGAILGDAASFSLGRRLGARLLRHRLLARHRRLIARTRVLTRRYGVASIFLGRFAGPARAFVPMMAGITHMPDQRFHLANAASGVVWVAAFLAPGYLAVRGARAIDPAFLGQVAATIAGLGLLAAAGLWIGRQIRPHHMRQPGVAAAA